MQRDHDEIKDRLDERKAQQKPDKQRDRNNDEAPSELVEMLQKRHPTTGAVTRLLNLRIVVFYGWAIRKR